MKEPVFQMTGPGGVVGEEEEICRVKANVVVVTPTRDHSEEGLETLLRGTALTILSAEDRGQLESCLASGNCDVCVIRSERLSEQQFELLQFIRARRGTARVVVSARTASVNEAVRFIKAGAADVVVGDLDDPRLREAIEKIVQHDGAGNSSSGPGSQETREDVLLVGDHPKIQEAMAAIMLVAKSETPVMITGESGTGKELVARIIHDRSEKREKPFVALHAAETPEDLMESELFGNDQEAPGRTLGAKMGALERANGGSLFLDQIDEIRTETQAKLLGAIDRQTFHRLEGTEELSSNVRPLAATRKDPYRMMMEGQFWKELYYRFSLIEVSLPPLRERKEDIQLLAEHFLHLFAKQYGKGQQQFSEECFGMLMRYDWPGNVRELRNLVERCVVRCPEEVIRAGYLSKEVRQQKGTRMITIPVGSSAREVERRLILETLASVNSNKSSAARILGLSRRTLQNKLQSFSLELHPEARARGLSRSIKNKN